MPATERSAFAGLLAAVAIAAALVLAGAAAPAHAASTFVWHTGGFERLWSVGEDWVGDEAPTVADGPLALEFPLSSCGLETPREECGGTGDDLPELDIDR